MLYKVNNSSISYHNERKVQLLSLSLCLYPSLFVCHVFPN